MRRAYLFFVLMAVGPVVGLVVWRTSAGRADHSKPAVAESPRRLLPLSSVVLFNTGVAYFQREGAVDGDTRIDLSFPLSDINDLLKSLVVEDGSKLAAVSYDGTEPAVQTLKSFAVDLTTNPTFGQILNQCRGERIEISQDGAGVGLPATMNGVIVGMESNMESGATEVHQLNLLCAEGMRRIPLARIQRIRILNPTVEDEFRRALSVLSAGHNNQRRSLSVHVKGEGKRNVKIGYVVESPIWKASYRLALDGKAKKSRLQGWAVIENSSDEDWRDVRVVLVSGRPITYQMDLSQSLFVPRPTVEPEVFASLRPSMPGAVVPGQSGVQLGAGGEKLGGFGTLGALGGGALGGGLLGGIGGGARGATGGALGGWAGIPGMGVPPQFLNRYQIDPSLSAPPPRLSWEELRERRNEQLQQREEARERAGQQGREALESAAVDADRIGEEFQYTLDQKVTLPRQKSALLPVLNNTIEVTRLSLYSKAVHPRFPLRTLRVKNTTGQHLLQGPVAVYDAGTYVGDARLPDLQPDQERLLSYAMDLGVEVRDKAQAAKDVVVGVRIDKGVVVTTTHLRTGATYTIRNRSKLDRSLLLEHPIQSGWKLVDTEKPVEQSRETYRFARTIAAGKTVQHSVSEERVQTTWLNINGVDTDHLRKLVAHPPVSKAVKDAIEEVIVRRVKLETAVKEASRARGAIQELESEQSRLRTNLDKLPKGSAAHKRALEKFDQLETHIEKHQVQLKEQVAAETKLRMEYEVFVKGLSAK
jgi:hypothetical protein